MIIREDLTEAFNLKPKTDINSIKKMTPSQLDNLKVYGSAAENLLKNKDFALFVHHYKFDMADELSAIKNHTAEDNCKRISIAHMIAGVDKLVESLQRAVYLKNHAVSLQQAPIEKE
jgi:hypothetical protein